MPLSVEEIVYVVVVVLGGLYALARTLALVGATRRRRIERLKQRRRFEPVSTESPLEDPRAVARARGLESIESQFTVLRRVLIPLIIGVTALLAAVPFIAGTSASMASLVGAVIAVVLGLALRPWLENAVAGLVISTSNLVRIGDTVNIEEWYGTIEDITTTHTTVKLWDWRRYLVPNRRMLQSAFLNYSLFDTYVWAHVEFWVAPDADLDRVREIAVGIPFRSPHFAGGEEPAFWVMRIEKDAVLCWVAAWAETPSAAWQLTHDVRTALLREFREQRIPLSLQRHRWSGEAPAP